MKTNLNRGERIIKIKNFIPGPRDFDYRKQRQVVQISNKTNRHNLDKQKRSRNETESDM